MKRWLFLLLLFSSISQSIAQSSVRINSKLINGTWPANWITCPGASQCEYGIYHFRKTIELTNRPESFIIHVSADNRYRLFVNGKQVLSGPARGDLYNWFYETIDIAPYLENGKNVVAALVWNMGVLAPVAQISNQTAFVVQGDEAAEQILNSDGSWLVMADSAYKPCSTDNGARLHTYMVVGPGDEVDAAKYPWGWETKDYNDSDWKKAVTIAHAVPVGYGSDNLWTLATRNIPFMEEKMERIPTVRRSSGITVPAGFVEGTAPLDIPAKKKASFLLDQTHNTIGYPYLLVSKGRGANIKLTYAEALVDSNTQKGNRDIITGKSIAGNYDIFYPDGAPDRTFKPLWLRTWRYIQVDIETGDDDLIIKDLYGLFTAYPFQEKANFKSNDSSLQSIWNVGWRTARLCAGETYFDCPYYEQLQYEGDTRIQSLISLYVTGDDRLMRKAITDFYHSRVPEGLTQGRYPSSRLQVIPPFSLYWVSMLHDYFILRKDDAFLEEFIQPARGVLLWYEKHLDSAKHMLGPMKWWNFVDWNNAFPGGTPDGANDGNSAIISLQFAYTLQQAAALFAAFGHADEAVHYTNLAKDISSHVYSLCFDQQKGIMANTPMKESFSQHASIMAILTDAIPANQQQSVMSKILYDSSLSKATFYYRFYLTQALKKAGMADLYYSQLKPWRDMLANGLTTFAENPDPTRSDCHAWSASPNYDFLATICGITPASPGFATVNIAPALGELTRAEGSMPHPAGEIIVKLAKNGKGYTATITLPANITGQFEWEGKKEKLHGGYQQFTW